MKKPDLFRQAGRIKMINLISIFAMEVLQNLVSKHLQFLFFYLQNYLTQLYKTHRYYYILPNLPNHQQ